MHVYMHVYIHVYIPSSRLARIYIYKYIRMHVIYIYTHIMYICVHIYTLHIPSIPLACHLV